MRALGASSESAAAGAASRRRLLVTVAGLALVGGAGLAWWRTRSAAQSGPEDRLWLSEFARLDGSRFSLSPLRGQRLVLNFWASWCLPCVEELPLLNEFYRQNSTKGWQVLGLAIDQPEPVRRFLSRTPVDFPVLLADADGIELGRLLGNRGGGLPFTVVLGSEGRVVHRKIGRITQDDLQAWAS